MAQPTAKYYVTSQNGEPWGSAANVAAMNTAFGAGNWNGVFYETVNPNTIFSPTVCFIYMDGSGANVTPMNNFLAANTVAMQNWVNAGGKLYINAAPSISGNVNMGFGHILTYTLGPTSNTITSAPGMNTHPIFSGPFIPAGTTYTGTCAYGILNGASVPVMTGVNSVVVLREGFFGSGRVMFGGLLPATWVNPQPNGPNHKANILSYLGACCGAGQSISVTATPSMVCPGQSMTLTATGGSGGTYNYWPSGASGSSIVLTPTANGYYNVVFTPTSGCRSGATIPVNIYGGTGLSISGNTNICIGNSFTLTANGASNYTWSTGSNAQSISGTPSVTTVYSVIATNTAGCTMTAAATVSVSTNGPTLTISGNSVSCSGAWVQLIANGASTYTWSTGALTQSVWVNPGVTTTYTVWGSSGACVGSAVKTVSALAGPTLSISGNTAICVGQSFTITANGANSYSWNTGSTSNSITGSPGATTNYTVVGTMTNGCFNSLVQQVNVSIQPTVNIAGTSTSCAGSLKTLTATGASNFTWSTGSMGQFLAVSPTTQTTYTVIGTNNGACSSTAAITLSVIPSPTLNVTGTNSLCTAGPLTLTATGANTYSWNTGASTSTINVNPSVTTVYTATGSLPNGCTAVKTVTAFVMNAPSLSFLGTTLICSGQTTTLYVNGAFTYTWNTGWNNSLYVINPTVTTVYTVQGSNFQGCVSPPATVTVQVDICTGLNALAGENPDIKLYPNPSKGEFTIESPIKMDRIEVFDLTGKRISLMEVNGNSTKLNLQYQPSAIYYIRVITKDSSRTYKAIKD